VGLDGAPIPCDKERLIPVLMDMWNAKVSSAVDSMNRFAYFHFRVLEAHLFAKSLEEPCSVSWGFGDDVPLAQVLERIDADVRAQILIVSTLEAACACGDEQLVRACVERGDDPSEVNERLGGQMGLQLACINGSVACVEYLLSIGRHSAIINAATKRLRITPLWRAAACGHVAVVEALLRAHADPAPRRNDGRSPLHVAAAHGHLAVVQALLAVGVSSQDCDIGGNTPLHYAATGFSVWGSQASKGHIVRVLLDSHASANARNHVGMAASSIAHRDRHHAAMLELCPFWVRLFMHSCFC